MQELSDIIKARRSVRKFKSEPVAKELIEKVVEAGLWAASGKNMQSPVIIAITKKELRNEISKINAEIMGKASFDPFYGAPVIILVVASKEYPNRVYDGSLSLGNMMLEAHELGLGSCWIHRAKQGVEQYDLYKKLLLDLGLQGEYEGIGHLALGYADTDKIPFLPRKENRAFFIK